MHERLGFLAVGDGYGDAWRGDNGAVLPFFLEPFQAGGAARAEELSDLLAETDFLGEGEFVWREAHGRASPLLMRRRSS